MSDIVHTRGNSTPMEYDLTAYEGISPLEARFVIKYLQCNDAGIAYQDVYGDNVDSKEKGLALIRKPIIKRAVNKQIASKAMVELGTKETIISEMIQAAQFDIADMYDSDGNLLPINKMPPSITKFITGVTVSKGKGGNEILGFKTVDKVKALEQLFKALNIVEFDRGNTTNINIIGSTINSMSKEGLEVLAREGIKLEANDLVGKREIAPIDFSDVIDTTYTEIVYETDDNPK
jgi:hypothetical protein